MEDWFDIAVKAGGATLALALFGLLLRPARGAARREAGLRYVEYAAAFKWLFAVMTAIVAGIGWALATQAAFGPGDAIYAVGLGVAGALIVGMFGYMAFVYRIAWDENFIHLRTFRHWNRRVPWGTVRAAGYFRGWQGRRVATLDAGVIWVYQYQRGHAEFLEMARDRISRNPRT